MYEVHAPYWYRYEPVEIGVFFAITLWCVLAPIGYAIYQHRRAKRRAKLYAVWLEWRKSMPEGIGMSYGMPPGSQGNEF